ncbi:hypothetical protein QA641_18190 [Bradyrhizobium sp. CB1650]|uniref:hypothetical protein n=1 Tax=Bradyrhizobium sp. CB1650 TaxID=3039153 RepID=UPI0024350E2A|nr:hypothetical protein [Bradyrhizobium sp. CB1650]WGD55638.1 hypothetical protein QA641_18190 [Bradyrhizobium sp. CB1650]
MTGEVESRVSAKRAAAPAIDHAEGNEARLLAEHCVGRADEAHIRIVLKENQRRGGPRFGFVNEV